MIRLGTPQQGKRLQACQLAARQCCCLHLAALQEKGWNAVEVRSAYDCWIRNIATWNADSGILMNGVWAGGIDNP